MFKRNKQETYGCIFQDPVMIFTKYSFKDRFNLDDADTFQTKIFQ